MPSRSMLWDLKALITRSHYVSAPQGVTIAAAIADGYNYKALSNFIKISNASGIWLVRLATARAADGLLVQL